MNTRIQSQAKKPFLKESDGFIISEIKGLPPNRGHAFYESAKNTFSKTDLKVLYFPKEQFELMRNGITKDKLTDVVITEELANQMYVALGIKYYLHVEILELPEDYRYDNITVTLRFTLINLTDTRPSYLFKVKTSYNSWTSFEPDRASVLGIAFHKAMKKLRRELIKD
ncbi:MAG: hypothetical protein ACPGJS_18945 [Flammeovirgaceae bacterium]